MQPRSWEQCQLIRQSITVDRDLMGRPGPVPFFEPPKTAVSVRVVPLPTVVVDALAAHLATFPSESFNLHQRTRDLIRRSNVGTMWLRVAKWIGLEELGSHDPRHYCAWLVFRHAGPSRRFRTGSGWERGRGAPHREPPETGLRRPHSGGCRPTSFVVLLTTSEDISYR
jgi:integrase